MVSSEMHPDLYHLAVGGSIPGPEAARDWEHLLDETEDHGLSWQLSQVEGLPVEARELLRQRSLAVSAHNLALAGELRQCLQALREAGVECVPVRGLAMMELVYGEIVARPMGDIDLLVRRNETDVLRDALASLGYREIDRRPGFSESFSYSLKFLVERSFTMVVEPHLSIAYPPASSRLDMDAVWGRCVPTTVVGEPTMGLCRDDLLLHLVLHIAHRDRPPLVWLWELDRFIRTEGERIDWGLLASSSRQIGVERIVEIVLAGLESIFDTPIPPEVSGRLLTDERAQDRTSSQAMAEHSEVPEREGLAQLLALEGSGRKSRYLMALLLPTSEFMMQQYGLRSRLQLPWAYVRRAAGFCWEGGKGFARLLLKRPAKPR